MIIGIFFFGKVKFGNWVLIDSEKVMLILLVIVVVIVFIVLLVVIKVKMDVFVKEGSCLF